VQQFAKTSDEIQPLPVWIMRLAEPAISISLRPEAARARVGRGIPRRGSAETAADWRWNHRNRGCDEYPVQTRHL